MRRHMSFLLVAMMDSCRVSKAWYEAKMSKKIRMNKTVNTTMYSELELIQRIELNSSSGIENNVVVRVVRCWYE